MEAFSRFLTVAGASALVAHVLMTQTLHLAGVAKPTELTGIAQGVFSLLACVGAVIKLIAKSLTKDD